MKKNLAAALSILVAAIASSNAHAITITVNNQCTTFVVISAFAGKNTQTTKLAEEVAWPGTTINMTTSACVQSIQTTSTVVGTLSSYFYPTSCKNITLNISKNPTSCYVQFAEQ